jgi:Domain of unknown function (DUF1814).
MSEMNSQALKDKIKNLTGGSDSTKAQVYIRNYFMERFLARLSQSEYKENFVLKGGMLVSALIGIQQRYTMDVDTTLRSKPLTENDVRNMVTSILSVDLDDDIHFEIEEISDIMSEFEYPGIRLKLIATLDRLRQPMKLDISTGDVLTPGTITISYKPMFDDIEFELYTYSLETLLAEKLETILARAETNTRMRDFYDIHMILYLHENDIDISILHDALAATSENRGTSSNLERYDKIFNQLSDSEIMTTLWEQYKSKNYYVEDLSWGDVIGTARQLTEQAVNPVK